MTIFIDVDDGEAMLVRILPIPGRERGAGHGREFTGARSASRQAEQNRRLVLLQIASLDVARLGESRIGVDQQIAEQSMRPPVVSPFTGIEKRFEPGFKTALMRKDIALATSLAHDLGVSAPVATAVLEQYDLAIQRGDAAEDFAAVAKTCKGATT